MFIYYIRLVLMPLSTTLRSWTLWSFSGIFCLLEGCRTLSRGDMALSVSPRSMLGSISQQIIKEANCGTDLRVAPCYWTENHVISRLHPVLQRGKYSRYMVKNDCSREELGSRWYIAHVNVRTTFRMETQKTRTRDRSHQRWVESNWWSIGLNKV